MNKGCQRTHNKELIAAPLKGELQNDVGFPIYLLQRILRNTWLSLQQ